MANQQPPVWFITGCSSGFGKELAKLTIARGWRTVVTARKPDELKDLVQGHEANTLALELDVTRPEQIKTAVQAAEEKFGRIDVLVNNAGYGYLAAIEEGEDDEVRKMFETNFFGLNNLTIAALPGMRKQRHDRGAARHAQAAQRNHCQLLVDRRTGQLRRNRLLSRDQIRRGRSIRVALH